MKRKKDFIHSNNPSTKVKQINWLAKRSVILFFLFFLSGAPSFSQADENLGSWYIYNGFFYLNPKLELFAETQFRLYEPISNIETFFIRPYLSYYFSKQFNMGMSVEYHRSFNYTEGDELKTGTNEIRLTLQGMLFNFIDRTTVQHRYRLEQRWVGGDTRQRARYRFQVTIPIRNKTITKGTWFINTNNEIMMDIGPELGLSQNRTYVAPGYQFSKSLNLQVGYMFIAKPNEGLHRLQFFITHKLYMYDK